MNENNLFEKVLKTAEEKGYEEAYGYLKSEIANLKSESPQAYYFLICLSSGCGKTDEALKWVKEADARGWWYRSDALDDDDLLPLKGNKEYESFLSHCAQREAKAFKESKALCTFKEKEKEKLVLCLHGNGQNAETALSDWRPIVKEDFQLEAVQSARPDSFGRFRWQENDEDWRELIKLTEKLPLEEYREVSLAGFSAGCNIILRAVTLSPLTVKNILLQSPWIPFFEENEAAVIAALKKKSITINIACGTEDEDCREPAEKLYSALCGAGVGASIVWQEGNAHGFPEDGENII